MNECNWSRISNNPKEEVLKLETDELCSVLDAQVWSAFVYLGCRRTIHPQPRPHGSQRTESVYRAGLGSLFALHLSLHKKYAVEMSRSCVFMSKKSRNFVGVCINIKRQIHSNTPSQQKKKKGDPNKVLGRRRVGPAMRREHKCGLSCTS